MKFPIFNTIYPDLNKTIKFKDLDIAKLNSLNLKKLMMIDFLC